MSRVVQTVKMDKLYSGLAWLSRLGAAVVLVLTGAFLLFLTVSAFVETAFVSTNNAAGELVELYADNVFLNALVLVMLMSTLYLLYRHSQSFKMLRLELLLMAVVLLLGVAFILSVKLAAPWYSDSYQLLYAAERAAVGDYAAFDAYFCRFPFQLGYVLYVELCFRLMGSLMPGLPAGYYRLALQGLNLLWLMLSYHALIQLVWQLFRNRRVQKITAILLLLCLPPVLSCTFLYGNIPGFALGTISLWMFAAFSRERRLWQGLLCALSMGLAVVMKLNMMIFFAALAIVWLLELLRKRSLQSLVCLLLTVASVLGLSGLPQTVYERRSGLSFGEGIPMVAWLAMGMEQGHAGPGWYKEDHTVDAFMESGMDSEKTAEKAWQTVKSRAGYFADNPGEALKFFSGKLRSQWNEPTYESLWINQVQLSYGEKGFLYELFCDEGKQETRWGMNQYQQLIFLGALLACVFLWHRRELLQCLPLLVVLGGILYHLLFEAKSQYALPYFVLMIPVAAYGFCCLFRNMKDQMN